MELHWFLMLKGSLGLHVSLILTKHSYVIYLYSVSVYSRGLVPQIASFVIVGAARTFLAPHIHSLFAKLRPSTDADALDATSDASEVAARWFWSTAPMIVIQNLLMALSYPATLAATISFIPDVRSHLELKFVCSDPRNPFSSGSQASFCTLKVPPLSRFLLHV